MNEDMYLVITADLRNSDLGGILDGSKEPAYARLSTRTSSRHCYSHFFWLADDDKEEEEEDEDDDDDDDDDDG